MISPVLSDIVANISNDFSFISSNDTKVLQSMLLDKCINYPSDPYLFKNTTLTKSLIRPLIEIGPCQPGIKGEHFIFPKNKNDQHFLLTGYNKTTKSKFSCNRNWLVYSPKSNKMFCFPCFLFSNNFSTQLPVV